jgi:phosphoribosylformylglycinamidine synthase PurS subunit
MKARVFVRLKPGVLDVQGKAVERGLHDNQYTDINNIRVGKLIELDVEANSEAQARQRVEEICQKVLANTIIENYEITFG